MTVPNVPAEAVALLQKAMAQVQGNRYHYLRKAADRRLAESVLRK